MDGGFALANQRRNQNAVDAAANAGAVLLMENLAVWSDWQPPCARMRLSNAVIATAVANGVDPIPSSPITPTWRVIDSPLQSR